MADLKLDPRLTPARPDLAAKHLEGRVSADRFVDGEIFEISYGVAPVRCEPFSGAMLQTEALKGERVTVYDRDEEGWAWGQLMTDGYVGWLPDLALYRPGAEPTHRVTALRSFAFPGPSIKLPPAETLPLGARLAVVRDDASFAVTQEGWYVPRRHVEPIDRFESDFVAVAERFVGTPYLWGGRSSLGIDCSGLVQTALAACSIQAPRDSDMQEAALGEPLVLSEQTRLQRGDLLFWKGHVAIVRDQGSIVHANAYAMATAIEPVHAAIARIAASGSELTAIRRLGRTAPAAGIG
ncbi:NLP/P60 [Rhodopseudomonas palustris HaA2]|uniref:NLP/P60 n=1 Tax=Rhodopseudomonas palustris (strain HaA2) TaxID=316058 RepID=Q2IZ76_RHOP2|nr:C40 family peptidase [Rhodopseudomonas palustris]ABD06484.1 NLP/P60 [Rhodopseudomonas palustris HaA2]